MGFVNGARPKLVVIEIFRFKKKNYIRNRYRKIYLSDVSIISTPRMAVKPV